MPRRMKLFPVLVAAFVMAACGMVAMNRLDRDIVVLQDRAKETRMRQLEVEKAQSEMIQEINNQNSESYIIEKARAMGYLMPGEIRFIVTNPEVLGEIPEATVLEEAP